MTIVPKLCVLILSLTFWSVTLFAETLLAQSFTVRTTTVGNVLSGTSSITASVVSRTIVRKVDFYRDDWVLIGSDSRSPYQISFDTKSVSNGTHTFFSVATNFRNQAVASNIVTVQVQNEVVSNPQVSNTQTLSCQAGSVSGWDPLPTFKKSYISSGKFAGAYLVAPAGYLNWYFANLGLLGFVDRLPQGEVRQYLNSYIANLERPSNAIRGYSIQDVQFVNPYSPSTSSWSWKPQDSDDSYAATFLSVVARYMDCSKDTAWLKQASSFNPNETNLQVLKHIAYNNLVLTTNDSTTGLAHTFQSLEKYPVYFTQDNTEVYKGLIDFVRILKQVGDSDANYYQSFADGVAAGIKNHLFLNNVQAVNLATGAIINVSGFSSAWNGATNPIPNSFYPGAVTQLFPVALGVPVGSDKNSAGLQTLNAMAPGWCNRLYDTQGKDPFMILGYGAALLGDRASAQCQLNFFAQKAQYGGATITVSGLSFYQRTLNLLNGLPAF